MLRMILLLCCLLPALVRAQALPWQQLQILGEASLNFLIWPVYNATLYGPPERFSFPQTRPFALALEYKRAFNTEQLVAETRKQWQEIGVKDTEAWAAILEGIFTDVQEGDAITLYVDETGASYFYFNQQYLGVINDPVFSEQFAAIWLSEKTTRPGFRDKLLGRDK
jgi:hypothetical protein